jgi:hypothetical protein
MHATSRAYIASCLCTRVSIYTRLLQVEEGDEEGDDWNKLWHRQSDISEAPPPAESNTCAADTSDATGLADAAAGSCAKPTGSTPALLATAACHMPTSVMLLRVQAGTNFGAGALAQPEDGEATDGGSGGSVGGGIGNGVLGMRRTGMQLSVVCCSSLNEVAHVLDNVSAVPPSTCVRIQLVYVQFVK